MTSMLTSKRSSKPAASFGNPPPTFPACFASPSCPIPRALPLWSLLPTRPCRRRNAPHRLPPAPSAGTSSTQPTSKAGFDFYNKLFGWTKVSDMDMGPMGVYRIFDEGDHKEMGDGGMMTKACSYSRFLLELLLQRRLHWRSRRTRQIRWRQDPERSDAGTRRQLDHPGPGPSGSHVLARQ